MKTEPQDQHRWLERLLGDWAYETECSMGPGQPLEKLPGIEHVRSLGGLWVVGEAEGAMPGGGRMQAVLTLGFDPRKGGYVGTWIGSMMDHLWSYAGGLDPAGEVLTLAAEGPSFTGPGLRQYRDIISFKGPDLRLLTSRVLGEDGQWSEFMTTTYRRA
jgi:hypothetical protein